MKGKVISGPGFGAPVDFSEVEMGREDSWGQNGAS